MLNKLLQRQIEKHLGCTELPEKYHALFKVVSESYDHYEKDHNLLQCAIDVSTEEMTVLNQKLKRETQDLKQSQTEISRILNNVDEVIFSMDISTRRYVYISAACEKVYGYTQKEFNENTMLWKEVIHPDDTALADPYDARLGRGEKVSIEYRIFHKNGNIHWLHSKVTPTLNEAGKLERIDIIVNDITERKIAQQKLEELNNELNNLFNSINDVAFSVDMINYRLFHISPACFNVYGYYPDDFYNSPNLWSNIIYQDDVHIREEQSAALNRGEKVLNQWRIIHKNGNIRWVENSIVPTMDAQGRLIRIDGITRDITDAQIAREALHQSELQFREFFESAPEAILVLDIDTGTLTDFNERALQMLNYSREDLLMKIPADLSPAIQPNGQNSASAAQEIIARAASGEKLVFEWMFCDSTGHEFICEVRLTRLDLPNRNLIRGSIIDITQKKRAEELIRESEERYRLISENPALGLSWASVTGEMLYVNDALCEMLGYSKAEFKQMHFGQFTHPDDMVRDLPFFRKVLTGELRNYQCEKRYITKSGEVMWGELNLSCVKSSNGTIKYTIAMIQNITARKMAEAQLKWVNGSLERKVLERTAKLKEANNDLEAFNFMVSHDLANPAKGYRNIPVSYKAPYR